MSNGPQSILRVEYEAEGKAQERLIPFVGQYVIKVDKDAKHIIVDWGLDY
jgi:16S rRNA processing protein RimM